MGNKKILYFSDLEGTLLREKDGEVDDKDLFDLVTELAKLGTLTKSDIDIRLISPVGFKKMNATVDKIDRVIARQSLLDKKNKTKIRLVEAAASPFDIGDDIFLERRMSKKLVQLPEVIRLSDKSRDEKKKYIDLVINNQSDPNDVSLYIYSGNGRNDIDAMKELKKNRNCFIICPSNSRTEIKNMADFASEKTDIHGVIDAFKKINQKIEMRNKQKIPEKSKTERGKEEE